MRILLTTDVAGGVWTYTEVLTDALVARGHEVSLVSFGGAPRRHHRAWLAARPELDFTALPHALEWMPEPEPSLSASVGELRGLVQRIGPDVVHLNQIVYGAVELGPPALAVAHSDVVSWWRAVHGGEPPDDGWFRRYRRWIRDGLHGARIRAAPSAWMAAQVATIYDAAPVEAVHNGYDGGRRGGRIEGREPLVVAVGRLWDEGKGVRDLAAAAELLQRRLPAARVVLAGPVRHPGGGVDFATTSPGTEWAGILSAPELAELLGRAAIYVATSRYEPFGLAPLEAAVSGCALVMSEIPTFRELWDGAAVFYPPGDAAALAEILHALLCRPARRDDLARAARERARQQYGAERMAARYETLYRALLGTDPHTAQDVGP